MANRKRLKNPPISQAVLEESELVGMAMEARFENFEILCCATDINALVGILAERGFLTMEEWTKRSIDLRKELLEAAENVDVHSQSGETH